MSATTRATVAAIVAAYGLVVMVVNARTGLLPTAYTTDWVLFGGGSDFPDDFGRNVFAGSIGLGILLLLLATAVALTAGRPVARLIGAGSVAFGVLLVALYDSSGNLLAAKPSAAAVFAAAGLFLLASLASPGAPPGAPPGASPRASTQGSPAEPDAAVRRDSTAGNPSDAA